MTPQLGIRSLGLELPHEDRLRPVLRGIDLDVHEGESVGLVGESGSGKSLTARSVLGMFPDHARVSGAIHFEGRSVLEMTSRELRSYRGREVAMIFQDPRAHINAVHRIGDFMCEGMRQVLGLSASASRARAIELLAEVGIPDGARRLRQFPHELSGGLLQRVMIAAALAIQPKLIVADEPTSALDVSTQNDVLELLGRLRAAHRTTMLLITHDLEVAAAICDRTAVMYAGELVEVNASGPLHRQPQHPYTAGLIDARPDVDRRVPRLRAIPGRPLSGFEAPARACSFVDRCPVSLARCSDGHPPMAVRGTALARCVRTRSEWSADLVADATGKEAAR